MPTPAERRALIFLSSLTLLGAAVRAARAVRAGDPLSASPSTQQAIRHQIASVDSARRAQSAKGGSRGGGRVRGGRRVRPKSAGAGRAAGRVAGRAVAGRMVGGGGGAGVSPGVGVAGTRGRAEPPIYSFVFPNATTVDADRASAAELDRLPHIGPVLAKRIVANRDSLGPFGSLKALGRVRGIGPVMLRRLAPLVTFSLEPRPFAVDERRRRRRVPRGP